MVRLVAVGCARGKVLPPIGFRMGSLTELRVRARTSRADMHCLTRGRPRAGPQAAGEGLPVVAFVGRLQAPSTLRWGILLVFPLHFSHSLPITASAQPKLQLSECWTHSAEGRASWTEPRDRRSGHLQLAGDQRDTCDCHKTLRRHLGPPATTWPLQELRPSSCSERMGGEVSKEVDGCVGEYQRAAGGAVNAGSKGMSCSPTAVA